MLAAMNVGLRKPRMTREEFFAWAQIQGARYEFDGFAAGSRRSSGR
jgi:hypothetical protein